jgi:hypothetical protein
LGWCSVRLSKVESDRFAHIGGNMLQEVDKGKFWSTLVVKTVMTKNGDVQAYRDAVSGGIVGYINVFVRRYFLVVKDEGKKDAEFVQQVKLSPQEVKEEKQREKAKAKDPNEVFTKYPHAIPGTLTPDEKVGKKKVRIKCTECGNEERWVYTSDLFQVKRCLVCQTKAKEARRAEEAEARQLVQQLDIARLTLAAK